MAETIHAEMSANVWKILVRTGDTIEEDGTIAILESMKMEIPVLAESAGVIVAVHVEEGQVVSAGQPIVDVDVD